jgi:hypothetical protein
MFPENMFSKSGDVHKLILVFSGVLVSPGNIVLEEVYFFIELVPVRVLFPELIAVVAQEGQGEETEQYAPECTPERQVGNKCFIMNLHFGDSRAELQADAEGVQGIVDTHIRVLKLDRSDVQNFIGCRPERRQEVWIGSEASAFQPDGHSVVQIWHQKESVHFECLGRRYQLPQPIVHHPGLLNEQEHPAAAGHRHQLRNGAAVAGNIIAEVDLDAWVGGDGGCLHDALHRHDRGLYA